jgi:nitrilase
MEASDGAKVRAASLVFDDRGELISRYDKIHLFDVQLMENDERYEESNTIEPGFDAVVVDTPFGRLGLAVCYDLRFPELFRKLQQMGAEIFVVPSAFTAITGKAHWRSWCAPGQSRILPSWWPPLRAVTISMVVKPMDTA